MWSWYQLVFYFTQSNLDFGVQIDFISSCYYTFLQDKIYFHIQIQIIIVRLDDGEKMPDLCFIVIKVKFRNIKKKIFKCPTWQMCEIYVVIFYCVFVQMHICISCIDMDLIFTSTLSLGEHWSCTVKGIRERTYSHELSFY